MITWLRTLYLFLTCNHDAAELVAPSPPPHQLRCKRCGCALTCGCWDCRVHREPHRDW